MGRPKKYPEELMQRGIRLALESGRPVAFIARDLGVSPDALRDHVRLARSGTNAEGADPLTGRQLEERRSQAVIATVVVRSLRSA
jgi:transposase